MLLDVREVSVRFGGIVALDGLSFSIDQGTICGLIGPNGAGKTTMFNVVSRIYDPFKGNISFDGHDLLAIPAHQIADLGIVLNLGKIVAVDHADALIANPAVRAAYLGY